MGKLMFVFFTGVIGMLAYIVHVDSEQRESLHEEQMRTVYTAMCGDNTFDVRFRTATPGDVMTLDGRSVQLSEESCTVMVKYVEEKR